MMIRAIIGTSLVAALAAAAFATPAAAQFGPIEPVEPDPDGMKEAAAHLALITTPVGALAPLADIPGLSGTIGRIQLNGQLGLIDHEGPFSARNFALGASIPGRAGVIRVTAGIADFVCDDDWLFGPGDGFEMDCGIGFFAGVDGTVPLIRPVIAESDGSSFTANLVVSLGASSNDIIEMSFADPFDPASSGSADLSTTSLSVAVGVPLAFVVRSEDVTVVPHLTPRIGYGRSKMDVGFEFLGQRDRTTETESDILPMLGAGVDILFGRSGFGLGLGVQKVFAEDSEMLAGINLSYRRR